MQKIALFLLGIIACSLLPCGYSFNSPRKVLWLSPSNWGEFKENVGFDLNMWWIPCAQIAQVHSWFNRQIQSDQNNGFSMANDANPNASNSTYATLDRLNEAFFDLNQMAGLYYPNASVFESCATWDNNVTATWGDNYFEAAGCAEAPWDSTYDENNDAYDYWPVIDAYSGYWDVRAQLALAWVAAAYTQDALSEAIDRFSVVPCVTRCMNYRYNTFVGGQYYSEGNYWPATYPYTYGYQDLIPSWSSTYWAADLLEEVKIYTETAGMCDWSNDYSISASAGDYFTV